ncbi:hypothetical protein BXZ70DRAFT_99396 [Cristinia sonorae]|uniref:Uncharacterized protein n=1 Tax=Cristinia sonorae TaxID=1940300 RepID=A0A8K0XQP2_9AGAR|nr:hypothetical protein BXZ70DRAFT_99396 [Cristinia sonorae]
MVKLKEVAVQILNENLEPLEEYGTTRVSDIVSCTVASEDGQHFVLKFEDLRNPRLNHQWSTAFDTWIDEDGSVPRYILHPGGDHLCRGLDISATAGRRFQFSAIDGSASVTTRSKSADNIGLIEVFVYKTKELRVSKCTCTQRPLRDPNQARYGGGRPFGDAPVTRSSRRDGLHRTRLGDEYVDNVFLDCADTKDIGLYATFKIMYKPKVILQANSVIPLPPHRYPLRRAQDPAPPPIVPQPPS